MHSGHVVQIAGFYEDEYNHPHMTESIENSVYTFRTKLAITQETVAQAVGVTRQTIIAIEKGNYVPSLLLALKLAKYFKKPVESVFSICKK